MTSLIVISILAACKQKEKEEDKGFISVVSLVKQQVQHIDTALYSIIKITYTDTSHIDTMYIAREDFEKVASDFLDIPDLSDKKVARKYKAEPARYDEQMNRVIITYNPIDPGKEEIKTQEILVLPDPGAGDKVTNIRIVRDINNRDSSLHKEMLWRMDKSFQVITTSQKPGKPEIITTTKVSWNEGSDQ